MRHIADIGGWALKNRRNPALVTLAVKGAAKNAARKIAARFDSGGGGDRLRSCVVIAVCDPWPGPGIGSPGSWRRRSRAPQDCSSGTAG